MASIINTYDANSTQVYPKTSTDALVFNDGEFQGAEAIAAALSEKPENLVIGKIEIVHEDGLRSPKVIAGQVVAESITDNGNLVVGGYTNMNGLNVLDGSVSVKNGGIDVLGDIDVSVGHVKADKANFKDCSFGPIHIDGNANKIYVNGNTTLYNGQYNYTLQELATQTGTGQHPNYATPLYVTGALTYTDNSSSKTYTDPSVFIKNGSLYTKGLFVGGILEANQIDPTKIVLKRTSTNLISNNKEFNFIPAEYNNEVYINHRTEGNLTGKITKYAFYDGSRGLAQLDASLYRCRGGRTCLYADDSSNGHLVIGGEDPSIRTYIQKDRVVVESSTGKSTFSRDSIELDPTNRYIKNTGTRLLTGNSSANYTQIYSDPSFIGLSVVGANTETILNLLPSNIYIDSPLVQMDSHARVGGDVSVYGKLNVVGDVSINGNILSYASIMGKNIQFQGASSPISPHITIYNTTQSLITGSYSLSSVKLNKDVPFGRVFFVVVPDQSTEIRVSGVGSYRGNIILIRVSGEHDVSGTNYGNAQVIGVPA